VSTDVTIAGIRRIYSDQTIHAADGLGGYFTAAMGFNFGSSLVWTHPVLLGIENIGSNAGRGAHVYIDQYTSGNTTKYGDASGMVLANCTHVQFGMEVVDCQAILMGIIYFLKGTTFRPGFDFNDSFFMAPGGPLPRPSAVQTGPDKQSMVVLYDTTSGRIAHVYKCVSLDGVKHKTKRQIERVARETMVRMAAGRPIPRDLSILHVDPKAIDYSRLYRVDTKRRALVKIPHRRPLRGSIRPSPKLGPKKASTSRRL
jgi:hypothetical protein